MNILFLFADQMRYDCLGVLNPAIRTPNLDRLARDGMLLTRAYAPTAVCLPCRAALATGQYPSTNGATWNHSQLPQDYRPLVAELLTRCGFYTHMVGKSHLNPCHDPDSPESAPHIHDLDFFQKWHGPWYGFERADIAIGHSTEKHACGMHYGAWLREKGVDLATYFGHTAYDEYGAWDLPEEYHNSTWTADVTLEAIARAEQEGKPFFIWSNFQDPHNPCMVPEPYASMYRDADIPLPGFKPGEPERFADKPAFYREILEQPGPYRARPSDPDLKGAGNVSHLDWDEEQVRRNAECYYGMVTLIDKHIGRILDALDEKGLTDNTLVVFSADHGDLLGDHGFWWKSLVAYEESIRAPMIVRCPGRVPAGTRSDALQNLIDLPPTFFDFNGCPVPPEVEGVSQQAAWCDAGTTVRQDTVVEERPGRDPWNQRILVPPTHKLAFYANRSEGELYDMQNDPHQVRNLWNDPAHRDLKDPLIARIVSHEINKHRPCLGQTQQKQFEASLFGEGKCP